MGFRMNRKTWFRFILTIVCGFLTNIQSFFYLSLSLSSISPRSLFARSDVRNVLKVTSFNIFRRWEVQSSYWHFCIEKLAHTKTIRFWCEGEKTHDLHLQWMLVYAIGVLAVGSSLLFIHIHIVRLNDLALMLLYLFHTWCIVEIFVYTWKRYSWPSMHSEFIPELGLHLFVLLLLFSVYTFCFDSFRPFEAEISWR